MAWLPMSVLLVTIMLATLMSGAAALAIPPPAYAGGWVGIGRRAALAADSLVADERALHDGELKPRHSGYRRQCPG